MPQEKSIDEMNYSELRQALAEFVEVSQPARPQQPDAPGCETLSPKARETAASLYAASIQRKPAGSWTPAERQFMRESIAATLREMGS